jgi:hypothetical protein
MYAVPLDNTIRVDIPKGGNTMAKDRKPAEELSGLTEKTMEQARTAVDTYF